MERPFENGLQHGKTTVFYESGNIAAVADYKYGKKHGYAYYYDILGKVRVRELYESNLLVTRIRYDKDGKFTEEERVDRKFYGNGVLWEEVPVKNGFRGEVEFFLRKWFSSAGDDI